VLKHQTAAQAATQNGMPGSSGYGQVIVPYNTAFQGKTDGQNAPYVLPVQYGTQTAQYVLPSAYVAPVSPASSRASLDTPVRGPSPVQTAPAANEPGEIEMEGVESRRTELGEVDESGGNALEAEVRDEGSKKKKRRWFR